MCKKNKNFSLESFNCYPLSKNYKKIYKNLECKNLKQINKEEKVKKCFQKLKKDFEEKLFSIKEFNMLSENEKLCIYIKFLNQINDKEILNKVANSNSKESVEIFEYCVNNKEKKTYKFKILITNSPINCNMFKYVPKISIIKPI